MLEVEQSGDAHLNYGVRLYALDIGYECDTTGIVFELRGVKSIRKCYSRVVASSQGVSPSLCKCASGARFHTSDGTSLALLVLTHSNREVTSFGLSPSSG